ncbi:TetR/AcrR family transcriptional regulator [Bacillus sp. FJAT-42376]|uniref:TetR/AcrR family transcriptional regulator n=1 Tax=Bacillus sp. FJAT-42376 TaxID=2014076 RepID=UPI0013DDA8DF|nr:TetR/AcrR family transcriptional regulator [Bacillus sp. FJAT-42376]
MKQFVRRIRSEQLIIESAKQLINQKGCQKTTFAELIQLTGLSKGAIYHYVSSKDDLMAKVLSSLLEESNDQFFYKLSEGEKALLNPSDVLAGQMKAMEKPDQMIGKIFVYLISRMDHQTARDALDDFYDSMFQFALLWIRSGQKHGTIHPNLDPSKAAELYLLMLDGFRLRTTLYHSSFKLSSEELSPILTMLFSQQSFLSGPD